MLGPKSIQTIRAKIDALAFQRIIDLAKVVTDCGPCAERDTPRSHYVTIPIMYKARSRSLGARLKAL
jgi:hypothetical protein